MLTRKFVAQNIQNSTNSHKNDRPTKKEITYKSLVMQFYHQILYSIFLSTFFFQFGQVLYFFLKPHVSELILIKKWPSIKNELKRWKIRKTLCCSEACCSSKIVILAHSRYHTHIQVLRQTIWSITGVLSFLQRLNLSSDQWGLWSISFKYKYKTCPNWKKKSWQEHLDKWFTSKF